MAALQFPIAATLQTHSAFSELTFIAKRLRASLRSVIVMLEKELHGHPPLLALDFDVLHGYLFPFLQSPHSRVLPSLATYVLDTFPNKFILPRGAAEELLHRAQLYHSVKERVAAYLKTVTAARDEYTGDLTRLWEDLNRLAHVDTDYGEPKATAPSRRGIRAMAEFLESINSGYGRMARLQASKIIDETTVYPDFEDLIASREMISLMSDIQARLGSWYWPRMERSRARRYRPRGSNRRDSQNVVSVMALQGVFTDRDRGTEPGYAVQLLTETRAILDLRISGFGIDRILHDLVDQGKLSGEYVPDERTPWMVCDLSTAAVYCAFRQAYGSSNNALRQARRQFQKSLGLSYRLVRFEEKQRAIDESTPLKRIPAAIGRAFDDLYQNKEIGRWYWPLRLALQQSAGEGASLHALLGSSGGESEASVPEVVSIPLHLENALRHIQITGPPQEAFKAIGLAETTEQLGDPESVTELTITSAWSGEVLLRAHRWQNRDIMALQWATGLTVQTIADILTRMVRGVLDGRRGRIIAVYDYVSAGPTLERNEIDGLEWPDNGVDESEETVEILILPSKVILRDQNFTKERSYDGSRILMRPKRISVETEIGDVHFLGLNRILSNIDSKPGIDRLVSWLLPATHSWRGVPGVCEHCLSRLVQLYAVG